MHACIDFGNTRGKIAFFEATGKLVEVSPLPSSQQDLGLLLKKQKVAHAIASTVAPSKLIALQKIWPQHIPLETLTHQTPLPIRITYKTPETLGMDRLAAVVGAWMLFPNQASLVIDLGTCVTYDFINAEGCYLGGAISPGLRMRSRAMHAFTEALPEIEEYENSKLIGKSTQECLRSGAVNGLLFEIEGHRAAYQQGFEIFNTVLCGGDSHFFESKLKAPIFVRMELVLIGLKGILDHLLAR